MSTGIVRVPYLYRWQDDESFADYMDEEEKELDLSKRSVVGAKSIALKDLPQHHTYLDPTLKSTAVWDLYQRQKVAAKPGSDQWHEDRDVRVTASDWSTLLGKNPYKTAVKLFRQKTKQVPRDPSNMFIDHGNKYEREAMDAFSFATTMQYVDENPGCVPHPEWSKSWIGATPDFILVNGRLVEIKCPPKRAIGHFIQPLYYPQIQVQLNCCGFNLGYFTQYKPPTTINTGEMDILSIERDPKWFEMALPYAEKFHYDVNFGYMECKSAADLMLLERGIKLRAVEARWMIPDWKQPTNDLLGGINRQMLLATPINPEFNAKNCLGKVLTHKIKVTSDTLFLNQETE